MQSVVDFLFGVSVIATLLSEFVFFVNAVRLPFHIKPEAKSIPFIHNPMIAMSNKDAITERGQAIHKVCVVSFAICMIGFVVTLTLCLFFWWIGVLPTSNRS